MPTGEQHGIILPTRARLRADRAMSSQERATLTETVKARALDWEDDDDPVFFDVIATGNQVDSYGTYMLPSTLRNFAADAEAGVSVLDSHRHQQLGFGQSVTGAYIAEGDAERMESTFFTIPGLEIEGRNTDSYIRGMRRGLWRDISVGFWLPPEAAIRCSICGKNMMDWWGEDACRHFPGTTYDVEADGTTRREVAYGGIDGARLSEYSLVYDGATPGAGVAKARQMEDAGELDARTAGMLEQIYPNVRFPGATGRFYAGFGPGAGERTMPADVIERAINDTLRRDQEGGDGAPGTPEGQTPNPVSTDEGQVPNAEDVAAAATTISDPEDETETDPEGDGGEAENEDERARTRQTVPVSVRTSLNARYAGHGIEIGENVGDALEALAAEVVRVRTQRTALRTANTTLEREAADGRAYRASLVDDMVTEAIRAMNLDTSKNPQAAERYRAMVEGADLDHIRALRDDFAGIARQKYGPRRSQDAPLEGERKSESSIPDEAYYGNA